MDFTTSKFLLQFQIHHQSESNEFEIINKIVIICRQVIDYVTKHGTNLMNPLKHNLVMTTFDLFQMTMDDAIECSPDDYQKFLLSWVQAATIISIMWGIGGILDDVSRQKFDQFHRKV